MFQGEYDEQHVGESGETEPPEKQLTVLEMVPPAGGPNQSISIHEYPLHVRLFWAPGITW